MTKHLAFILILLTTSGVHAADPAIRPTAAEFGGTNTSSMQYNNLIAWFPIWEPQGAPIVDLVLGLQGAIYVAPPTIQSDPQFGNYAVGGGNGQGGGTTRAYRVPYDSRIEMGGLRQPGVPWGVSFWFRTLFTTTPAVDSTLLAFSDLAHPWSGLFISLDTGNKIAVNTNGTTLPDAGFKTSNTGLFDRQWHHILFVQIPSATNGTYSATNIYYVDGVLDGTYNGCANIGATTRDLFFLGADDDLPGDVAITDFRFYRGGTLGAALAQSLYAPETRWELYRSSAPPPPPDTTVPTVSVTAPAGNTTVSGTITISGTASDNVGVAGVQFRVDGVNQGVEDSSSPYSNAWFTTSAANGTHTLTAVARDAAGNSTTSAGITVTVSNTVTPPPSTDHNKARANSYDDAWQSGASGWVEKAKSILAGASGKTPGFILIMGDSLSRGTAMADWANNGSGKTAEDIAITQWLHASPDPITVNSKNGFGLATPYICSARSYTVGDGLGAWDLLGSGMPAETNLALAQQRLLDCAADPNSLNLTTIMTAFSDAQFAVPEYNLLAPQSAGSDITVFTELVNALIAKKIVPIIITYTYRTDATFNTYVDNYNIALKNLAQTMKLPLIDFQAELLARRPFSQWPGNYLSDGTHYTNGSGTADPYTPGGDPATHTTGDVMLNSGYKLRGWLIVQKMKEIKEMVIDGVTPPPPPANVAPTVNAGADQTIVLPASASLAGSASDDGLPNPPAALTHSWTKVSGPGTVVFGNSGSLSTTATFSLAGTYVLRLTASDSLLSSNDIITITASAAAAPQALISASPAVISAGATVTLSWIVQDATTISINQGIGTVTASGSRTVNPTVTTTYILTATGPGGTITTSVTVTVQTSTGTPLPKPIFNLLTNVLPLNADIQLTNAGSYTGATFTWNVNPVAPSAALGKSGSVSGVLGTPRPVLATSAVPRLSLASMNLTPGPYLITVQASVGSQTSALGSANVTLVQANLSAVRVYPNPWRSDRHAANRTITFDNLTVNTSIKIFTTSGHHVKTLPTANTSVSWDLTNEIGDRVASGIYMYVMKAEDGSKKTGQVVLIK